MRDGLGTRPLCEPLERVLAPPARVSSPWLVGSSRTIAVPSVADSAGREQYQVVGATHDETPVACSVTVSAKSRVATMLPRLYSYRPGCDTSGRVDVAGFASPSRRSATRWSVRPGAPRRSSDRTGASRPGRRRSARCPTRSSQTIEVAAERSAQSTGCDRAKEIVLSAKPGPWSSREAMRRPEGMSQIEISRPIEARRRQ